MSCTSLISAAINPNCPATPKGFEQDASIYNKADIETVVYDVTTGLVTSIIMKSGKKGYPVTIRGTQPFKEFKVTGEQKNYGMMFKGEVSIIVLGNTPNAAATVNVLTKGEFVLLLTQKGVSDSSKYPIIGIESGLIADSASLEPYGDNGGWIVPMSESMREAAGLFVWITDLATTNALIAATLD